MVNDRFAQLLALQFSGEATEEQLRELQELLESNPKAQFFYEVFSDYWKMEPKEESNDIQDEIHFQQIISIAEKGPVQQINSEEELPQEKAARIFPLKKLLVAASVLSVVFLSYFFWKNSNESGVVKDSLNEVVAKAGTRSHLMLPDGSKVWLNSETKLEYKGNFNDSIREVYLEGEAYFDVVKDKSRPFIVHTSDLDIKVLGTAFNVKSYPKEYSIEATLIHGMIEVINKKEPTSPKLILRPHDKLVFNKCGESLITAKEKKATVAVKPFEIRTLPRSLNDTAIAETSWIYNKLVFDGETLLQMQYELERWYNVKINIADKSVANTPIRYELRNETIKEALNALQLIEPFDYKINGNEIEILKK
jgi:transmembrane sensor